MANKIYENCSIFSLDGKLVGRCKEHRINWYVKKGLGVLIGENPKQVRLTFNPIVPEEKSNDLFNNSTRENKCVVCGSEEKLTQHHVIPQCLTKLLPKICMDHNSHDVLAVCFPCHMSYEIHANKKRFELAAQYNIDIFMDQNRNKLIGLARGYKNATTDEVRSKVKGLILEIQDIDIDEWAMYKTKNHRNRSVWLCQEIINKVEDIQLFFEDWRNHFIVHTNPKYLPIGWDVHRKVNQ